MGGIYLKFKMPYSNAFKSLLKSTRKTYLYKDVPSKFRKQYGKKYDKEEVKEFKKGTPKQDGSGGGMRLNKGRGGCEKLEEFGKGRKI